MAGALGKEVWFLVAAPVFAQIMQGTLRLLSVPHDAPLEPVPLPGAGEEAREST